MLKPHCLLFSIRMATPGMLSLSRTETYCTKLADEITKLRGEKALMDFKIHVKDDEFPCAKFVMAAHSPMLRAMLMSDMAEVAKHEIRLDHINKDIIQIILAYMYSEDITFHKDQLMDLISAADYLQMAKLKEMCLSEVPDILDPGNVISWWKEAAKMSYDTIKEKCEGLMAASIKKISRQNDFLNLDLNEIQHYASNICTDSVNSDHLVNGLMRWVNHKDERVPYLEDLLNKGQLNKCSAKGLKNAMDSYESLLDKTSMTYKLLLKSFASITTHTDTVVVIGGEEGHQVNPVCWKVEHPNEIVHLCDIPDGDCAENCSVCKVPHGFVISGGECTSLCMMFIASTNSWVRLQDMLGQRDSHGFICVRDVLYVFGGYVRGGTNPSDSVHLMIMKDGKWTHGPNMSLAVKFPKVSNLGNNVYLLDEASNQLLCLDIDKHVWKQLASLPTEKKYCVGASMTSAQGRLFVAGGHLMICAWYNPNTNTWCTGQQPLHKHKYGALAYHNDKLLLLGGSFEGGTDAVEEYDIEEDTWTVCLYKMPRKIEGHHAVVLNMQTHD